MTADVMKFDSVETNGVGIAAISLVEEIPMINVITGIQHKTPYYYSKALMLYIH